MRRSLLTFIVPACFCAIILAMCIIPIAAGSPPPSFYLGTDKSFGTDERPYVNLEGDGSREYSFRVYKVEGIDDFFSKRVQKRL